jgi:sortase (surface protein transpeptidase)
VEKLAEAGCFWGGFLVLLSYKIFKTQKVMDKRQNYNQRAQAQNSGRGSIRVPSRGARVTMDNLQAAPVQAGQTAQAQQTHSAQGQPQHYYQAQAPSPQPVAYQQYPTQGHRPVMNQAPPVAPQHQPQPHPQQQHHQHQRPIQQQNYQRAVTVAASQQRQMPMPMTMRPGLPTPYGAVAVPMVRPKQPSKAAAKIKKIVDKLKPVEGKIRPSDIIRYSVVTFFVIMASYLAFDTWQTNQQIQSVFSDGASAQAPSEEIKTSSSNNNSGSNFPDYKVADDLPRVISIPKINLTARVKSVGLTPSNKIDVPVDASYAGWYSGSSKLRDRGAAFMTGHYNGVNAGGVFDRLNEVAVNDKFTVEMGDGEKITYQVTKVENLPVASVDMAKALQPDKDARYGLNIMTCSGTMNGGGFSHRLIVYSKAV